MPSCGRKKYFINLYNKDFQLSALPIFFKNQNDFDFWATYDLLNNIDLESEIILPMHLRSGPTFYIPVLLIKRLNSFDFRCASHTLNLIASTDIDLSKFDNKQLPKKQALRKALGKMNSLWNKICRSILAAELSKEAFGKLSTLFTTIFSCLTVSYLWHLPGVAICTPCPTRWNSTYDSLESFLSNYKSLDIANQLFTKLGLPSLTKEDIDLLNEYMLVMKPLAILLDIFQGEKGVFLGLGMVLPLLSKLKEQLKTKLFPNLNAIRDRVITSIDNR